MNFSYKFSNLKKNILGGGGGSEGRGGGRRPRVSDFFTKDPNLNFFGGGGGRGRLE